MEVKELPTPDKEDNVQLLSEDDSNGTNPPAWGYEQSIRGAGEFISSLDDEGETGLGRTLADDIKGWLSRPLPEDERGRRPEPKHQSGLVSDKREERSGQEQDRPA